MLLWKQSFIHLRFFAQEVKENLCLSVNAPHIMKTYAVLYNPLAGNGRGKEASLALRNHFTDGEVTFTDITSLSDYKFFSTFCHPMLHWGLPVETVR